MNSSIISLSPQQLRQAATVKEQIERLQNQLARLLGSSNQVTTSTAQPRRRLSAASRARIAAAARARWAKIKSAKPAAASSSRPKRQLSAAARARLSAIARARWKKARALGQMAL